MQQAWETEQHNVILQKIPAGKRGFFYAGVFSDHPDLYGQKAGGRRAPGAGGGTVLHAKGTGGTRGEKFFSVSLADEKDMIYIIAHKDEKAAIMRSINEQAGPGTKAGAICFSLPISSVAGLRAREEN